MDCKLKRSLSELVLSAVFCLQRQNGITWQEIACYVAKKRCVEMSKIKGDVQCALKKAVNHKILCEKSGQYRIKPNYDDQLKMDALKKKQNKQNKQNEQNRC